MSIRAEGLQATAGGFCLQVDLDVPAGTCVAVVGPNGAGKTTLLHALAGIAALRRGRVELAGEPVDDPERGIWVPPERRPMALHSQANLLFPHLSVLENVAFGLRCSGLKRRDARSRAREWLERLGLSPLAEQRPEQLSGGQAQRVGLARAAACEPPVLLLDESLAALDAETRIAVRRLVANCTNTRLLVTHDPLEARVLADELLVLEAGRVVQSGTPDEVAAHPRTRWVATLLDTNLLTGTASDTRVTLDGGFVLTTATRASGPVLVTFSPAAVTLSVEPPHTSARNTWQTTVSELTPGGDRVRVRLNSPAPCWAWVTPGALAELGLTADSRCWASIKATELSVQTA